MEHLVKQVLAKLKAGEKLSVRKVANDLNVSRWKASVVLSMARAELNKLKLELIHTPQKPKNFTAEKQTYKYLQDVLFDISYKVYSPVLKGLPDFIVISTKHQSLKPGFYEVKLAGRKLSPQQEKLMKLLSLGFNVYLVEVHQDGTIQVFKWG